MNNSDAEKKLTTQITVIIRNSLDKDNNFTETVQYKQFMERHGSNPEVLYRLAQIFLYGIYVKPNEIIYKRYLDLLEKIQHPGLHYLIAYDCFYGIFGQSDESAGNLFLELAKGQKYNPAFIFSACNTIKDHFANNKECDKKLIYNIFSETMTNTVVSEFMTALCLFYGIGVEQNFTLAMESLNEAARRGFYPAKYFQLSFESPDDYKHKIAVLKKKPKKELEVDIFNKNFDMRVFANKFNPYLPVFPQAMSTNVKKEDIDALTEKIRVQFEIHTKLSYDMLNDLLYLVRIANFWGMEQLIYLFRVHKFTNPSLNFTIWKTLNILVKMSNKSNLKEDDKLNITKFSQLMMQELICLHNAGVEINHDIAKANYDLLNQIKCEDKDENRNFTLTCAVIRGIGVEKSEAKGLTNLISLADKIGADEINNELIQLQIKLGNYAHAATLKIKMVGKDEYLKSALASLALTDKDTQYRLAQICIYSRDSGFTKNDFEVFCKTATELKHEQVDYLIGYAMLQGLYNIKDLNKAKIYFTNAAKTGYIPAKIMLAKLTLEEETADISKFQAAIQTLELLKEEFPLAQYLLAIHQENDDLLKKAADRGCNIAQYQLGKKKIERAAIDRENLQTLNQEGLELIKKSIVVKSFFNENMLLLTNKTLDTEILNYMDFAIIMSGVLVIADSYYENKEWLEAELYYQAVIDDKFENEELKNEASKKLRYIKKELRTQIEALLNKYLYIKNLMNIFILNLQKIQNELNKENRKNKSENSGSDKDVIVAKIQDARNCLSNLNDIKHEEFSQKNISELLSFKANIENDYSLLMTWFIVAIDKIYVDKKMKTFDQKINFIEKVTMTQMREYLLFSPSHVPCTEEKITEQNGIGNKALQRGTK